MVAVLWLPLLASLTFCGEVASDNRSVVMKVDGYDAFFEETRTRRQGPSPDDDYFPDAQDRGFFYDSFMWLVRGALQRCIATFIAKQVAIVPCQCVMQEGKLYESDEYSHRAWLKTENGEELKLMDAAVLRGFTLESFWPGNLRGVEISDIKPHKNCTSLMKYNIALITTAKVIDRVKIAWVHTPEDIIFGMNMRRVVIAQSIIGRCVVPWINHRPKDHSRISGREDPGVPGSWPVYFQRWDACRPIACPKWTIKYDSFRLYVEAIKGPYVRNVCVDHVDDTKLCMKVTIPEGERTAHPCSLPPGLPVYCNMGRYNGLFGFIVTKTFGCSQGVNRDLAIFQPLSISIEFIREYLRYRQDPSFIEDPDQLLGPSVPDWAIGVKRHPPQEIVDVDEHVTVRQALPREGPAINQILAVWAEDQTDAVVNVYDAVGEYRPRFLCSGVQFAPNKYIIPCFCVHKVRSDINQKWRVRYADPQHWVEATVDTAIQQYNPANINVRLAKYDSNNASDCRPVRRAEDYKDEFGLWKEPNFDWKQAPFCHFITEVHRPEKCKNNGLFDFAYIETALPLQWAKNVWIHSANHEYMKSMMTIFPASSLIGGNCFVLNFTYIPKGPRRLRMPRSVKIKRIEVVFSPWDFCMPLICDPDYNYPQDQIWQTEICYNYNLGGITGSPFSEKKKTWSANARECISSPHGEAICDLPDGTPMFCDTDEMRGLIGIISKANMPGCTQTGRNFLGKKPREVVNSYGANSSAIIMKLSEFIDDIASQTVIGKLEASYKFAASALSRVPSVLITLMAALMTLVPMFLLVY